MAKQWSVFLPWDIYMISKYLEENKEYAGRYKSFEEAIPSIQSHLIEGRTRIGLPESGEHFTSGRIRQRVADLARKYCRPKTTAKDLIEKGSVACRLRVAEVTEDEAKTWAREMHLCRQERECAAPCPTLDTSCKRFSQAGTVTSVRRVSENSETSEQRTKKRPRITDGHLDGSADIPADSAHKELASTITKIEVVLPDAEPLAALSDRDIQQRIGRLQKMVVSAVKAFVDQMQPDRLCFTEISSSGRDTCSVLVPESQELVGEGLELCYKSHHLEKIQILSALVGAVLYRTFQQFRLDRSVGRTWNVDQVVRLFGPGCELLRTRLRTIESRNYLESLKEDRKKLQQMYEPAAKDAVNMLFDLCEFPLPENFANCEALRDRRRQLGKSLLDVFEEGLSLRIDLALHGDSCEFLVYKHGVELDGTSMQDIMHLPPCGPHVGICQFFGIRDKCDGRVISKAFVA